MYSTPYRVTRLPRFLSLTGQGSFFKNHAQKLHPDRRGSVPLWGGKVHRIFGVWEYFAPSFVILSIPALPKKNSEEPKKG
jgi:hypothetical protein